MRFIIYGAGGVGGVIGARLFQQGHEVILIARGAHLEKIQSKGLFFERPKESITLKIPAVGHPSEINFQKNDVVLLTMKTQHCLPALEELRDAAGDEIPVICGQNGVNNERMALRRFRRVYGMSVYLPALHLEPGVVQTHTTTLAGILDLGVFPQGTDALVDQVTKILSESNFSSKADPKVMRWKYAKLLLNLRNSLQAACPLDSDTTAVGKLLREEALACYQAAGIDYPDKEEENARRAGLLQNGKINGKSRQGGSSWQSMAKGSGDIEVDYLNGEIVLLGRLHGIPTPANQTLQNIANQLARKKAEAGCIPIDEIEAKIKAAQLKGEPE
ncbi:MAG: ketopantoate reductase family protein [SAR324 cluster bacterium]|nr:ketopantoate reductase family protein [SAR324 cluster bacterium]